MKNTYWLLIFSLLSFNLFAQEPVINFEGRVINEGGRPIQGVTVKIKRDGKEVNSFTTNSGGKYGSFEDYYGFVYLFEFSKDGYVSSSVEIDTKNNYYEEDVDKKIDLPIDISLFEKQEGVDYSIISSKPRARVKIDGDAGLLNYDMPFINSRKTEIDQFFKDLANKEKENAKKFKELVAKGDNAVKTQKYEEAISSYESALKIKNDKGVEAKLDNARNLLADFIEKNKLQEQFDKIISDGDNLLAANKFDEAINKYKEAKIVNSKSAIPDQKIVEVENKRNQLANKEVDKKYDDLMAEANSLKQAEKYEEAIKKYEEANGVKPKEITPKTKIEEIKSILKGQIDAENKYRTIVNEGNDLFKNGDLKNALKKYVTATSLKPSEGYPKEKIEEIKAMIAKNEAEAKAGKELDDQYNSLIAAGDREFSNQNYTSAKEKFEEALKLKPSESYPKDQLDFIKRIFEEQEKRYNEKIVVADKLFGEGKYQDAIFEYQSAQMVKPVEQYPKDQIKKARDLLNQKNEELTSQKEMNDKYEKFLADAQKSLNYERYEEAKSLYQRALEVKPGQEYPTSQLKFIDDKLAEIKRFNEKNQEKQEVEANYRKALNEADNLFESKEFDKAKEKYKEAYSIKNERYPQDQINRINQLLKEQVETEELKKQYDKIIKVADQKLLEKQYIEAKNLYNRALVFRSTDYYPKKKIQEIDDILAQLARDKELSELDQQKDLLRYSRILRDGDRAMSNQKYDDAKARYNEALSIKPDDTYPKEKLAEIEKLQKDIEERENSYKKLANEYFKDDAEMYGEEVGISELEATQSIRDSKNDRYYDKYKEYDNYSDSMIEFSKDVQSDHTEASYKNFEDYDRIKEDIKQNEFDGQKSIEKNAKMYENYNDKLNELKKQEQNSEDTEMSEIEKQINEVKENIIKEEASNQKAIEQNADMYEKYQDKLIKDKVKDQNNSIDNQYGIERQIDYVKEEIIRDNQKMRENNEQIPELYESYNDQLLDAKKEEATVSQDNQYVSSLEYNQIEDLIIKENKRQNLNTEQNAKLYEDYSDRLIERKVEEKQFMDDFSSEINKEIEQLKSNLINQFVDEQKAIEQNALEYERYQDKLSDNHDLTISKMDAFQSEIANQIDDLKEDLIEENKVSQLSIEQNAKLYEDYNDRVLMNKKIDTENEDKMMSEIESEINNVKDNIIKETEDNQLSIEKNALQYEMYGDKLIASKVIETEKNEIKNYDNHLSMEKAKEEFESGQENDSPNRLALIFPEGVTQKVYQKKNEEGKVIEVTVRRVVVSDNKGNDYKKVTNNAGTFYFKNGNSISSTIWDIETSGEIVNAGDE